MPAHHKHALERAIDDCRVQFDKTVARAEQVLENAQNEYYQTVSKSASTVADIVCSLETCEALEQNRMAAKIREELAQADANHRAVVDGATKRLEQAFVAYVRTFGAAATAMECSFNAASAASSRASSSD